MSQPTGSSTSINNEGNSVSNSHHGTGPHNANTSDGYQFNFSDVKNVLFWNTSGKTYSPQDEQVIIDNYIHKSLAFPEATARRDAIATRYGNSCQWILSSEEYLAWEKCPFGILWIKGKPGAGKSTLMAFLSDKFKETPGNDPGIQIEFFFTKGEGITALGTELQRSPLGMFRSLLNQIFACDESIRPQIRDAYKIRCKLFGNSEGEMEFPEKVLEKFLTDAILDSASRQPLTIFVDALDETGAESAQKLEEYFARLISHAKDSMLRVCISCRHYPIINHRGLEIIVENHNHNDIRAYIKDKIHTNAKSENDSNTAALQSLTHDLIVQANGVFQWAQIVMPTIQRRILEVDSPKVIRDGLPRVPHELRDVYRYILRHLVHHENREQSFLLFQWVCFAERPLTLTEMQYAMAAKDMDITPTQTQWPRVNDTVDLEHRMEQWVKTLSGGLTEMALNCFGDKTIEVVHQSVKHFLRAEGLATLSKLPADDIQPMSPDEISSQCQATLYRSCFICFATAEISNQISRSARYSFERFLINACPLLKYAIIYLFVHAEKAGGSRIGVVSNEIPILEQQIGKWVHIYRQIEGENTARPATGTTLLHMASYANMLDIVGILCYDNSIVNRRNTKGQTAMHFAAAKGHTTAAEKLLVNGADCEAKCAQLKTPLVEAAKNGHLSFVEWLLSSGVNVNVSTGLSGTALQAASSKGKKDIVSILLEAGANVNRLGGKYGNALHAGIQSGNVDVVQMLLDAGADTNAISGPFTNALFSAISRENLAIIQTLLNADTDVNSSGGKYGNALQAAAYQGNIKIVQMLLEADADVNAHGGKYGNALQAASSDWNIQLVNILLEAGADVNAEGGHFGTALQAAASNASPEVVRILLKAGANVNIEGGCFGNALQAAVRYGSIEIVELLLEAGADVNAKTLQAAKSEKIVQLLLRSPGPNSNM